MFDGFDVTAATDGVVVVGSGKAFLLNNLVYLRNASSLVLPPAPTTLKRIDAITIKRYDGKYELNVITGTKKSTPEKPTIPEGQLLIAYVLRNTNVVSPAQGDITQGSLTMEYRQANRIVDQMIDEIKERVETLETDPLIDEIKERVETLEADPLSTKNILLVGDSLMYGDGWLGGFGNCILENHPGATVINVAVSGSKLTGGDIFQQIVNHYNEGQGVVPDIILVNGGGNDFIKHETLGTVSLSSSFPTGNHATVADSMDELIYNTKQLYPNAKIVWMSLPPMMQWNDGLLVDEVPVPSVQKQYFDEITKVCGKYGVPTIDLFNKSNITSMIPSQLEAFYVTNDTIHLKEAGYRHVSPLIESVITTL